MSQAQLPKGPPLYPMERTERVNITVPKSHADKAREISIGAGTPAPGNVGLGYRIMMQAYIDNQK